MTDFEKVIDFGNMYRAYRKSKSGSETVIGDKKFASVIENYGKKIPEDVCFHFEIAGDILKESTIQLLKA